MEWKLTEADSDFWSRHPAKTYQGHDPHAVDLSVRNSPRGGVTWTWRGGARMCWAGVGGTVWRRRDRAHGAEPGAKTFAAPDSRLDLFSSQRRVLLLLLNHSEKTHGWEPFGAGVIREQERNEKGVVVCCVLSGTHTDNIMGWGVWIFC